jgi:hypothetical protein
MEMELFARDLEIEGHNFDYVEVYAPTKTKVTFVASRLKKTMSVEADLSFLDAEENPMAFNHDNNSELWDQMTKNRGYWVNPDTLAGGVQDRTNRRLARLTNNALHSNAGDTFCDLANELLTNLYNEDYTNAKHYYRLVYYPKNNQLLYLWYFDYTIVHE